MNLYEDTKLEYDLFPEVEDLPVLAPGILRFMPSPDSETIDVALQNFQHDEFPTEYQPNQFPHSPRGPPDRNTDPGKYNFTVEINSDDIHRKTFLYSHRLSRIYVNMKCDFSIHFNWDHVAAPDMLVRATAVFADDPQAQKRVEKCVQHYQENITAGLPQHIAKNVLHSSRELNAQGVYYCGEAALADSWLSVLVEFHRESPSPCSHAFKFTCKNSCTSGINRRAIAIMFTLEDRHGTVYGRHQIGTRVCACPRRDMLKDESSEGVYKSGKKRVQCNQIHPPPPPTLTPPVTKKMKIEKPDDCYTLPPLPVLDKHTMEIGLQVMRTLLQQGAEHRQQEPRVAQRYAECVAAFDRALHDLNEPQT